MGFRDLKVYDCRTVTTAANDPLADVAFKALSGNTKINIYGSLGHILAYFKNSGDSIVLLPLYYDADDTCLGAAPEGRITIAPDPLHTKLIDDTTYYVAPITFVTNPSGRSIRLKVITAPSNDDCILKVGEANN